jgi:hypothetical protein
VNFQQAVQALEQHLSLEPLSPGAKGEYVVVFDARLEVCFRQDAKDQGLLTLWGVVAHYLPEEEKAQLAFLEYALQAALGRLDTGVGALALDPQTQSLIVYDRVPYAGMASDAWLRYFQRFVDDLDAWQRILRTGPAASGPASFLSSTPFVIYP